MPEASHSAVNAEDSPPRANSAFASSGPIVAKILHYLQREKGAYSHWKGQLSTSALSTATAVSAMSLVLRERSASEPHDQSYQRIESLIQRGRAWLNQAQNEDGGFGDTDRSHSNIATTLLVLAAWKLSETNEENIGEENTNKEYTDKENVNRAWAYVESQGSWQGLRARYGKDKTFVVPILTNCALAGLVDWEQIPDLPFEAAALPQSWYRFVQLPVVSYAIPALVAIGQAKYSFSPPRNPITRFLRKSVFNPTFQVLDRMQPESGGYLEAVPLTSFVLMSLAATARANSKVAKGCLRFIDESTLEDGSWPIDTNLATWVTSLTVRALLDDSQTAALALSEKLIDRETVEWLLSCQHRVRHPFTGAEPGGWGWTDLSGAVPDADDTPAAILALVSLLRADQQNSIEWLDDGLRHQIDQAVNMGLIWLKKLQNRDGGWPTFCRGWGTLPFDRSGSDLTAHALRALCAWYRFATDAEKQTHQSDRSTENASRQSASDTTYSWSVPFSKTSMQKLVDRGLKYLQRQQRPDGSWLPLWFGNQDHKEEENPIYGTARVLVALREVSKFPAYGGSESSPRKLAMDAMIADGSQYLASTQNSDGGWGGGPSVRYPTSTKPIKSASADDRTNTSTVEETAQAVEALLSVSEHDSNHDLIDRESMTAMIQRGRHWLEHATEHDWLDTSWPIGFYFAKLWYHERQYPWIYTLPALKAVSQEVTDTAKTRVQRLV